MHRKNHECAARRGDCYGEITIVLLPVISLSPSSEFSTYYSGIWKLAQQPKGKAQSVCYFGEVCQLFHEKFLH